MINQETLLFLKTWFADYAKKFQSFNPYYQQNINLKYNHTKRVCSETPNDFKLLQMAWIYDINFPLTFQLIQHRAYLQKIGDSLPPSEKVQKIYSTVKPYLDKNCKAEIQISQNKII